MRNRAAVLSARRNPATRLLVNHVGALVELSFTLACLSLGNCAVPLRRYPATAPSIRSVNGVASTSSRLSSGFFAVFVSCWAPNFVDRF